MTYSSSRQLLRKRPWMSRHQSALAPLRQPATLHPLQSCRRFISGAAPNDDQRERLRIAVVGGGVGGLSTALHLAPLVDDGTIVSIDVFEGGSKAKVSGREIGVGVWSTALEPFRSSIRKSHQAVWEEFLHRGRWLDKVGYRSPSGVWLAKSELGSVESSVPSLLFLRECDMINALRKGIELEEEKSTIRLFEGQQVMGIQEDYTQLYSAPLMTLNRETGDDAQLKATERDYHLIIAADGTNSNMRLRYGGHRMMRRMTGSTALSGNNQENDNFDDDISDDSKPNFEKMGHVEANAVEHRGYTVFRGNSNMTISETGMDGISFQTWGEGNMMRFATVPMSYPKENDPSSARTEKQVWFATTSLKDILEESDATLRKEKLMHSFASWHDPIARLMEATPAEDIIMEKAVAHKHSVGPVRDVSGILADVYKAAPPSNGPGPAIGFIGDAFMTVDPILAQGFTLAMEASQELQSTVRAACQSSDPTPPHLSFDPRALRKQCQRRYNQRNSRIVHLLRATDVVQALGQPQSGFIGALCRYGIRPAMQVAPDWIKTPIFNAVMQYSLGLPLGGEQKKEAKN